MRDLQSNCHSTAPFAVEPPTSLKKEGDRQELEAVSVVY